MRTLILCVAIPGVILISGCGRHAAQFGDPQATIRKVQFEQKIEAVHQDIQKGNYVAAFNKYNSILQGDYQEKNKRRHLLNLAILAILAEDLDAYGETVIELREYESDPVSRFHIALSEYVKTGEVGRFSKKERKIFIGASSKEQRLVRIWVQWLKGEKSGISLANYLIEYRELSEPVYVGSLTGFVTPILDRLLGIQCFTIIL